MAVWEQRDSFWCLWKETDGHEYENNAIALSPYLHQDGTKIIYSVGCHFPEKGGIYQYDLNENQNKPIVLWNKIAFLDRLMKTQFFGSKFHSMCYNKTDNKVVIFAEGGCMYVKDKVIMEYYLTTKQVIKFTDIEKLQEMYGKIDENKRAPIGPEPALYLDANSNNLHIIGGNNNLYHLRYVLGSIPELGRYLLSKRIITQFPACISHHRIIKNPVKNELLFLGGWGKKLGFLDVVYKKKITNVMLVIEGFIRNIGKLIFIIPKEINKICLVYLGGDIEQDDRWGKTRIVLPHKMADFGCISYGNNIIIFGGTAGDNNNGAPHDYYINRNYNNYFSSIYCLNMLTFQWTKSNIELPKDIKGNCIAVLIPEEDTVHLIDRTYGKHFRISMEALFPNHFKRNEDLNGIYFNDKQEEKSDAIFDELFWKNEDKIEEYIDKEIEEEIEIEQDIIREILFDETYCFDPWYMSLSDVKNYHLWFIQADTNKDGVIDGSEANKFFSKSKLNRIILAKIWVLADQNKQGKLSENMFCAMCHLVMKIKKSGNKLNVPNQLPKCLTENVVKQLGTKIKTTIKEKKIITQKKIIKIKNPNKKHNKKHTVSNNNNDDDLFGFVNFEQETKSKQKKEDKKKVFPQPTNDNKQQLVSNNNNDDDLFGFMNFEQQTKPKEKQDDNSFNLLFMKDKENKDKQVTNKVYPIYRRPKDDVSDDEENEKDKDKSTGNMQNNNNDPFSFLFD